MISPIVGTALSLAVPTAGRQALALVDQATATFAELLGAAADTLQSSTTAAHGEEVTTPEPSSGHSVSIESIRTLGKHLAADYHRRAISQLEAAGVDITHEFSLRLGSHGEAIVIGDHPDKELIEQVLNSDEFSELFSQLAGLQEIAHAYDERSAFREAFTRNPLAAVAEYSQSGHDNLTGVLQLTLDNEGIVVEFPAW